MSKCILSLKNAQQVDDYLPEQLVAMVVCRAETQNLYSFYLCVVVLDGLKKFKENKGLHAFGTILRTAHLLGMGVFPDLFDLPWVR